MDFIETLQHFLTNKILLTLTVLVVALILFVLEWYPVDFIAICVAVILIVLGLITPSEGISGFSHEATITVMAMFILSAGISRTGVISMVRDLLVRWGGNTITKQIIVLGVIVGPISAFINNTAVVAVFLPIVEEWCRKRKIPVSKMLIPLSFVTVLAGMITLIGTSTNIVASGLSQDLGYRQFSLFQFTALGIITFLIGLAYLAFIGHRLLPSKDSMSDSFSQDYGLQDYVTEIIIIPGSSLIGKTLRQSAIQRKFDLDVLEIIHNGNHFQQPLADKVLSAGDILLVRGSRDDLLQVRDAKEIEFVVDIKFGDKGLDEELTTGEEKIAEILILSNSRLIGSTLKDLRFRQRYNVTVLAIRRGQELVRERLGKVPLKFGDLLLVQGPKESFIGLQTTRELLVIEERDLETLRQDKALISLLIVLGVILVAAFDILPILVTALIGVILMVLTGCLKPGEIYGAVRWDVIFLLAGLIPLGIAMDHSGATEWLANKLVDLGGHLSGYWILLFFYIITSILTEILSNSAAVVLMLPIAVKVAESLSLNPYAFMFSVTFAASNSYMTPIGYQTNTMVYSAGGYRFMDFVKIGAPLNIILTIATPLLIMVLYGLQKV